VLTDKKDKKLKRIEGLNTIDSKENEVRSEQIFNPTE